MAADPRVEADNRKTAEEAYSSPYYLDFDLARNEAYHRSEMQFYLFASNSVAGAAYIAASIAVVSLLKLLPLSILPAMTLLVAALVALDRRLNFERQRDFHHDKMMRYLSWRAEHNANRNNSAFVAAIRKEMEREWAERSTNTYTVHFGVDALAYNDAVLQLFPEGQLRRSHLLELLWWERLAAHILPFSRERFLRRRDSLTGSLGSRVAVGLFWAAAAFATCTLGIAMRNEIRSLPVVSHYVIETGWAIAVFLLVDAAYHRIKSAFLPRQPA
jgi:hypothetical protein